MAVLYDQLEKKTAELEEVINKQSRQDKMTRSFCQSILRKEHDVEPGGGKDKETPWFRLSTVELLQMAEEKYNEYFDTDTKGKTNLAKDYREKLNTLASLVKKSNSNLRELEEESAKDKKELEELKEKLGMSKAKKEEQKKEPKDKSKLGSSWTLTYSTDGASGIIEEDIDYDDMDRKYEEDIKNLNEASAGKPKGSFPSTLAAQRVLEEKERAKLSKNQENLVREYLSEATESEKAVLVAIGKEGFSELAPLFGFLKGSLSESKVRICALALSDKKVLNKKTIYTPRNSRLSVFQLSDYGKKIYETMEGKPPVLSKAEKIKKEHSTLEHGYAIVQIAEALEETPFVKKRKGKVTCMTGRKQIKLEENQAFVPDITIDTGAKYPIYIEYETTKCSPEDFNYKCDKFAKVTDRLNFIVPSQEALDTLKEHAERWIEKTKKEKSLDRPITISMSTFRSIQSSSSPDMLQWDVRMRANSNNNQNREVKSHDKSTNH